jgi:hypothetical protein
VPPAKRDSAIKAIGERDSIANSADRAWEKECTKKFNLDEITSARELQYLMRLHGSMPDPDTAYFWRVAQRALAAKDLTPSLKADILAEEIGMPVRGFGADTAIATERVERILSEIDALPDSLADRKLGPHFMIMSVYRRLGLSAAAGAHARTVISLARRFGGKGTLQAGYETLAWASAERLHADSAVELLRAAERDAVSVERIAQMRRRYELIGRQGAPVAGQWWLNSSGSSAPIRPGDGNVHLIEFTAHFCTRCRRTYPGLRAIADHMKGRDFDIVLVTETYGFFEGRSLASTDEEVAFDRAYYERDTPFRVAIARRDSATPSPAFVAYEVSNEHAILAKAGLPSQFVANIPQIVVVDRRGIVRAIVGGFEDGGEARISGLIENLLTEKPPAGTPCLSGSSRSTLAWERGSGDTGLFGRVVQIRNSAAPRQVLVRIDPGGHAAGPDANGYFRLLGLREGRYAVRVDAPGYIGVADSITLGPDGLLITAVLAREDGNIMCPPSSLRAPNTTDRQLVMYPFVAPDSSFAVLFPDARPEVRRLMVLQTPHVDYASYVDHTTFMVEPYEDEQYRVDSTESMFRNYPNPGASGITGTVVCQSRVRMGRFLGKSVRVEGTWTRSGARALEIVRAFVTDGRMYLVSATAMPDSQLSSRAAPFLDSFRLLTNQAPVPLKDQRSSLMPPVSVEPANDPCTRRGG